MKDDHNVDSNIPLSGQNKTKVGLKEIALSPAVEVIPSQNKTKVGLKAAEIPVTFSTSVVRIRLR